MIHTKINDGGNCCWTFDSVFAAYEILSDKEKRKLYDKYGEKAFENGGQGGGFGDFNFNFDDFFKGFDEAFGGFSGRVSNPSCGSVVHFVLFASREVFVNVCFVPTRLEFEDDEDEIWYFVGRVQFRQRLVKN